jgi:ATP diphosphatase
MIRRHPHVFGDAQGRTTEAVQGMWEEIKAQEKTEKRAKREKGGKASGADPASEPASALDGVPVTLPALTRALKLQQKAGRVGFDWNDPRAVLAKIREEADEIEAELDAAATGASADATAQHNKTAAEVGDLLFAVVNLARHLDADPEAILRAANLKFERRFHAIERALAKLDKAPKDATLAEMDALWDQAKSEERD